MPLSHFRFQLVWVFLAVGLLLVAQKVNAQSQVSNYSDSASVDDSPPPQQYDNDDPTDDIIYNKTANGKFELSRCPPGVDCTPSYQYDSCRIGSPLLGDAANGGRPPTTSVAPVFLSRGAVREAATDLSLTGPLFAWRAFRTYDSTRTTSGGYEMDTSTGVRWEASSRGPYINYGQLSSQCAVYVDAATARNFDGYPTNYSTPPDDYNATLVYSGSGSSGIYTLTEFDTGRIFVFYDFSYSVSAELRGRLKERTTREYVEAGLTGTEFSYNSSGYVSQITTAEPQSWTIDYTYYASGVEADRVEKIEIKDASGTVIRKAEYTYYGNVTSPSADLGSDGDLVQVKVSRRDSAGGAWIVRTTQYRYHNSSSADGKPHQLKAVFEPEAVLRITSAGNTAVDTSDEILSQDDTYTVTGSNDVGDYASRSFTYYTSDLNTGNQYIPNSVTTQWGSEDFYAKYGGTNVNEYNYSQYGRVKTETINGSCASCSGGEAGAGVKKTYYYMLLNSGFSIDNSDVVQIILEDTQDSQGTNVSRKIYGLNSFSSAVRQALIEDPTQTTQTVWCKSLIIDSDLRMTESRGPSAHTLIDTDSELKSFLDPMAGSNDSSTLNDSSGLISVFEYNTADRPTATKVKKGENGTAYYVSAADYGDGSSVPEYLITAMYSYPAKTTTRSSGKQTTYAYTFWDTGKKQIKKKTTTFPTISTGQNGSGVATTTEEFYDRTGRVRFVKNGEGYVNYYSYHPEHGGTAFTAIDVNPSSLPTGATGNDTKWVSAIDDGDTDGSYDSSAIPTRGSGLPTALALVSTSEFDDQGRVVKETHAGGAEHFTVYEDGRTILFPNWDSSGSKCLSPIQISVVNDGGQVTEVIGVAGDYSSISVTSSEPTGFSSDPAQSDYVSWVKRSYTGLLGQLDSLDRYHDIPSSGAGTLSTNFYRTLYRYDDEGRREYTIQVVSGTSVSSSTEQVSRSLYDILGRVVEMQTGVSDDSHNMTSGYTTYPTLRTRAKTEFDEGGIGDSRVTQQQTFHGTGATDYTGVNHHLTYRGHLRGTEPVYHNGSSETSAGPFTVHDIDWEGHVTSTAKYTSNPTWSSVLTGDGYSDYTTTTTNRRSLSQTAYDDLGRAYQTKTYAVNSSGAAGDALQSDRYYDRASRVVATAEAGGSATETAYDGAGRAYQTRKVLELEATKYASGAFSYRAPAPNPSASSMSGGDDMVITLSHTVFDDSGSATEQHSYEAIHTDTDGIDMTANDDYVRSTAYHWYDAAHRRTASGNYGAGDTTAGAGQWKHTSMPTRPASAPSTSDTVLVTSFSYDSSTARQYSVTDPAGTETRTFFDDLGRTTWVAENYDDFDPATLSTISDATDKSKDRVVNKEYNGLGSLTTLTAYNGSSSSAQDTVYLFEDSVDASRLTNEIYPDSSDTTSSGSDQVKYSYHVDGKRDTRTDERSTVITYSYDDLRRLQSQKVTTLGSSTDGSVRSITRGYDSLGRVSKITSHGNQTDDPDNTSDVVNQVVLTYDDLGHVTESEQSHSGVVSGSTPSVQYTYDSSATSGVFTDLARLESITYPDSRVLYYDFGTSDGIDDRFSRAYRLRETNGTGTILVEYSRTGGGQTVLTDYQQPDLKLDLYRGTSGTYAGLDRFGRVVDQFWDGYNSTSDAVEIKYGYDYSGNRTWREDVIAENNSQNFDELYSYDGLDRLTGIERGEINGTYTTITSDNFGQGWTLEQQGNWSNFTEDSDGNGTDDLNQDRTHNDANEITDIDSSSTHIGHDAAGNMTKAPKPGSWSSHYTLTWDAWNRLVKVEDGASTVAEYEYDGTNRRVVKKVYSGGSLDETQHIYLSQQNQVLEVRIDSDTTAHKQFTWGSRYIDDLVLRERDSDSNGTLDETLYAIQDGNWNVMALANTSGTIQERFHYAPYGKASVLESDFSADGDGISDYDWEYRYTSREYDGETGIYYFRARYYHPSLGRFCSRDPIGFEGSEWGLYEYAESAPLDRLDPSGMIVSCTPWRRLGGRPCTPADNATCATFCKGKGHTTGTARTCYTQTRTCKICWTYNLVQTQGRAKCNCNSTIWNCTCPPPAKGCQLIGSTNPTTGSLPRGGACLCRYSCKNKSGKPYVTPPKPGTWTNGGPTVIPY